VRQFVNVNIYSVNIVAEYERRSWKHGLISPWYSVKHFLVLLSVQEWDRLPNHGTNVSLILVALRSQTIPTMQRLYPQCNVFPLYPYCNAFPASCLPVLFCVRRWKCVCVCVFLQVCFPKCNRLWQNTLNVCRKNHTCHDFHTDVDCFVMTVVRTDNFSRTFSVTIHSPLVSYRTWNWFGVRCCVTPAADLGRVALTPLALKPREPAPAVVTGISGKTKLEYLAFLSHITPRTVAARVADCERSSLSFWGLHWPFSEHGLWLE
jgi:hypothetical protein